MPYETYSSSSATSAQTRQVPTDTTAPVIAMGGELYDLRAQSLTSDAYDFDVEADDPGTGTKDITIALDGTAVATTTNPCDSNTDSACDSDLEWTLSRASVALGSHTITVTAHDEANNVATASFTVNLAALTSVDPADSEDANVVTGGGPDQPSGSCAVPGPNGQDLPVVRHVSRRRGTGTETTTRFVGRAYRVAECDAGGRFLRGQIVEPTPIPGGGSAMLVTEEIEPVTGRPSQIETTYLDYASPDDPGAAAAWREHGQQALDAAIPPTPGA